jgi:hypothetical protein
MGAHSIVSNAQMASRIEEEKWKVWQSFEGSIVKTTL